MLQFQIQIVRTVMTLKHLFVTHDVVSGVTYLGASGQEVFCPGAWVAA